jgi:serine/threonine-protein kinase HipA
VDKLIVTLYGKSIGRLTSEGPKTQFEYLTDTQTSHVLSLSLPFEAKRKSEQALFRGLKYNLPNYFENLLPEGWLFRIAKSMKNLSLDTKLDMLAHLCLDTMGAVSFEPEESAVTRKLNFDDRITRPLENGDRGSDRLYCGYCGKRLVRKGDNGGFHEACSLEFFGESRPPVIDVDRLNLEETARRQLSQGASVPGAQQKFSVRYSTREKTIQMPGFHYIIKPRQPDVPEIHDLPKTEHIIMKFAGKLGLETAETSLIKLKDGNDAFITRRFDRDRQGGKLHAEDFAQATGLTRGTESEYHGSMELIAKVIRQSPMAPDDKKLSLQRLLKSALFNYMVGNSDAHLKNHSLIWEQKPGGVYRLRLSPFYDIVPCRAYANLPDDELGLKLGGINRGLTARHFAKFAEESCDLSTGDIKNFISQIRSERSYLVDLMRAYSIEKERQEKIFTLIAEGIKVIEGKKTIKKGSSPK